MIMKTRINESRVAMENQRLIEVQVGFYRGVGGGINWPQIGRMLSGGCSVLEESSELSGWRGGGKGGGKSVRDIAVDW